MQQAMKSLQHLEDSIDQADLPFGISLYNPQWHQGVIGILASRIKEKFNRPVIVFADDCSVTCVSTVSCPQAATPRAMAVK